MAVSDWTEDERQLVLDFYNLSSLQPTLFEEAGRLDGLHAFSGLSLVDDVLSAADSLAAARALLSKQDGDPLGVADEQYRREVRASPQTLALSSAQFDANAFLARVHADTGAADLLRGKATVRKGIDERDSVVKEMVRQNFARFVTAKNSIDLIFQDMRDKNAATGDTLFGTKAAVDSIRATCERAAQIFRPLLKRNEEEAEVRKRLLFLSKYRNVFGVKRRLQEARLSGGDFGPAVHEYKKGRQVVQDVRDAHERDSLGKFWQGQVEPEARELKEHIAALLVGPAAPWGRSFDDHHRLMLLLKAFDPKSDPMKLWVADYTQRLLEELQAHCRSTLHKLHAIKESWRDEPGEGESVEAALLRSLLAIIKSGASLGDALPRLDFECAALWTEQQQFFEGTAVVFERVLRVLAESGADEDALSDFAAALTRSLSSLTDSLLRAVDCGVQSPVVCLFGVHRAVCTLVAPLLPQRRPGRLRTAIEECVLAVSRKLLSSAWSLAPAECKRIARWVDWDIDAADYSTAVMRSLERLLLHYFAATARIMHRLQKSLFLGRMPPAKSPVLGLERHVQACLAGFLDEMKAIVVEEDQPGESAAGDTFRLPSVATSYKLLLSLANLLYFRQVSMGKIAAVLSPGQLMPANVEHALDALQHAVSKAYLGEKQAKLCGLLQAGLFHYYHGPHELKKPRRFIFELLSLMAAIQTEISDVSKVLLRPLMGELVARTFTHILSMIRALDRPIAPDMFRQLDAEVAILEDVLATGMSEEAEQLAAACHDSLGMQVEGGDRKSIRFNNSLLLKQFFSFQYT